MNYKNFPADGQVVMYCPKHFQMPESSYAEFIKQFPLATLVSNAGEVAIAQCPLIYQAHDHCLLGHLAVGNPLLDKLQDNQEITVLFNGNQGYISASWYNESLDPMAHQEVPTWNYSSLECVGTIRQLPNHQTLEVLTKQTHVFETMVNERWSIKKLSEQRQLAMIKGITAFEISIKQWQGKQKLSQNKSQQMQQRLVKQINKRPESRYQELLSDMQTISATGNDHE